MTEAPNDRECRRRGGSRSLGERRDVFTDGQREDVAEVFEQAGYFGPLQVAPVTRGDERVFLLDGSALATMRNVRDLEHRLQKVLGVTVWVVAKTDSWPTALAFE